MDKRRTMDIVHYKKLLLQQRDTLQTAVEMSVESTKPVELDQTRVGRLTRMDALQAQAMSLQAEQRRGQQLQKITLALIRIDTGNFGYCLRCEELIPEARLTIDPCATVCVGCASELENS